MKLLWTEAALADRRAIFEFIAPDNPRAAESLDELFGRRTSRLVAHPYLGRRGRMAGTRELVVHRHYVVIYDLLPGTIRILRLLHTSLQWPAP